MYKYFNFILNKNTCKIIEFSGNLRFEYTSLNFYSSLMLIFSFLIILHVILFRSDYFSELSEEVQLSMHNSIIYLNVIS